MAEALDPVNGLPATCEFLPTIAKVKAFLEPRWQDHCRTLDRMERFNRKGLPEPERDPVADARVAEGFKKLKMKLCS